MPEIPEKFRHRVELAFAKAADKSRRLNEALSQRGNSVQLGDIIYVSLPNNDLALAWTVIWTNPDPDLFLCAPYDMACDWAGTPDVGLSDFSAMCGPAVIRCGFSLWIPRELLKVESRVGLLEEHNLLRVQDKISQIFSARIIGSPAQQENDADIDLQEHLDLISAIHLAMMAKTMI